MSWFRLIILSSASLLSVVSASDQRLPMKNVVGIPKSRVVLYQPNGENFQCFDGSNTILFKQVNDNYCDCVDGSDEPGTSACSNGHFFCQNLGYTSEYIPSSRVNDKICDCCDGSDEHSSGVSCPNLCEELGRATRVERERLAAIAKVGFAKRLELAKAGKELKNQKLKDVEPLKEEKTSLETYQKDLEVLKKTAEDLERKLQDEHRDQWNAGQAEIKKKRAADMFLEVDKNSDAKLTLDEVKLLPYLDTDHDGVVSDEEAKNILSVEESDIEHFVASVYDLLKSAKRSFTQEKKLREEEEAAEKEPEPDDDLVADEDKSTAEEPHSNEEVQIEDEDEKMPPYPQEAQAATEEANKFRKLYDETSNKLHEVNQKIKDAETFASADFGEDFAWAPLKGQCFETTVMQYVYKLCPFEKASQKDKGGYGETSLGNFKDWTGAAPRKHSKQTYHEGQQCWNGPQRSTQVEIECGEENEIVEVSEPAKCEYHFTFRTPAACNDPEKEEPLHTEL
ncbi:unnamed protein product [Caenorhabditis auriculariae]|uniref:Glucosidase 2 subunit beta n=1 Tax=Caenorhabditis auriculariae TaxID=2777116 RepID=A0A8S1HQ59_9PELO|nr:unnamed protein product [Caenorhabditis auriculariae]